MNTNFFEIIKLIDSIFPSKSEINYTEISPEALITRFNEKINSSGIRFDVFALQKAKQIIMDNQKYVYKRNYNVSGGSTQGFDQNNFYIQSYVSGIKFEVLRTLYDTIHLANLSSLVGYDPDFFGDLATLKTILTKDKIAEYVKNALTITFADNDRMSPGLYEPTNVARDILTHFGLNLSRTDEISKILKRVVRDATVNFDQRPGDSDTGYVPISNREEIRTDVYSKKIQLAIEEITGIVWSDVSDILKTTEIFEASHKRKGQRAVKQNAQDKQNQTERKLNQPKKKPNNQQQTPPRNNTQSQNPEELSLEELQKTIERYQRLEELAQKNRELSAQLQALEKEMQGLSGKLAELEKQKKKLESQIKANNATMKGYLGKKS